MPEKLYGFYSTKAVRSGCSTSLYSMPDGREVEVTCVCRDEPGVGYVWEDKVPVGEVVTWLRRGYVSSEDQQMANDWDYLARRRDYQDE